jgi:hypothetical protein
VAHKSRVVGLSPHVPIPTRRPPLAAIGGEGEDPYSPTAAAMAAQLQKRGALDHPPATVGETSRAVRAPTDPNPRISDTTGEEF